jgi:hypothetical protein
MKLPAKRESQGLIAGHKRRLSSGRIIDVNKGVPSRAKTNRKAFLPRNRARIVPKKIPVVKRPKFKFPPRKRKTPLEKLEEDAKRLELEVKQAQEEFDAELENIFRSTHYGFTQDPNGTWLFRGEKSYKRFIGFVDQYGLSEKGFKIVDQYGKFEKWDGKIVRLKIFDANEEKNIKFFNYLNSHKDKPIIIHPGLYARRYDPIDIRKLLDANLKLKILLFNYPFKRLDKEDRETMKEYGIQLTQ